METVIVTLCAENFEKDFELPCAITLGELYPRLLAALQATSSMKFGDYRGVILEKDGAGLLERNATLLDYGICTGGILTIAREEKYDGVI